MLMHTLATIDTNKVTEVVVTALMLIVTTYLIPFLKQKAAAAEAEANNSDIQATNGIVDSRQKLMNELRAFLLDVAENFAEKRLPELAKAIQAGSFNQPDQVKAELHKWGDELKQQAIDHFKQQDIDLVQTVGDDYLQHLIEWAANQVSPFPGRDSAKSLMSAKIGPLLIEHGVQYIRQFLEHQVPTAEVVKVDMTSSSPIPVTQEKSEHQAPIPVTVVNNGTTPPPQAGQ